MGVIVLERITLYLPMGMKVDERTFEVYCKPTTEKR